MSPQVVAVATAIAIERLATATIVTTTAGGASIATTAVPVTIAEPASLLVEPEALAVD
jgi:hypothetical protein